MQVAGDPVPVGDEHQLLAVRRPPGPGRGPVTPGRRTTRAARASSAAQRRRDRLEDHQQHAACRPRCARSGTSSDGARSPPGTTSRSTSPPAGRCPPASARRRPADGRRGVGRSPASAASSSVGVSCSTRPPRAPETVARQRRSGCRAASSCDRRLQRLGELRGGLEPLAPPLAEREGAGVLDHEPGRAWPAPRRAARPAR